MNGTRGWDGRREDKEKQRARATTSKAWYIGDGIKGWTEPIERWKGGINKMLICWEPPSEHSHKEKKTRGQVEAEGWQRGFLK